MSKEIVAHSDFATQMAELDKIQDTCKKLLQTKHYQQLGEAGVHAVIARAKSLGIHPFEALNGLFFCINGKVGMSTETMAALVRQKGHSIQKDAKSNGECVILHGKRADNGDTWTCKFDKEDAIAAGLWSSATWKKYPQVMLYNRCMSMLFRQLFPDLSLGAGYVEDELREITRTGDYKDVPSLAEAECEVKDFVKKEPEKQIAHEVKPELKMESVNQLISILENCSPEYKAEVSKFMKAQGIMEYKYLPPSTFEKILKRSLDAAEDYKKEQDVSFPAEIEEVVNE